MRWPRLTTRRSMLAVLGIAVATGLALPAVEASRDEEPHCHSFLRRDPPSSPRLIHHAEGTVPPFWTRYRRHLGGRDIRDREDCGARSDRIEEVCAWAHPEILGPVSGGSRPLVMTAAQRATFRRPAPTNVSRMPAEDGWKPESASMKDDR